MKIRRVKVSVGFEIEGIKKHLLIVDNQYVDEFYMSKLI